MIDSKMVAGPLLCVLLAGAGANALAEEADGATLYRVKTCVSCHGESAQNPILPVYPKLAGQNADYLYNQLRDIKSGVRKNAMTPAMNGIMQNVNEDEMRILADWIAAQGCSS
ncbi:MAG: cytochrome c [Thiohalocapsa sp.]